MVTSIIHNNIGDEVSNLYSSIKQLVDKSRASVAVTVNSALCLLNYSIGKHILQVIGYKAYDNYGKSILATLSQRLTAEYGRGFTYSALTRMVKIANTFEYEMFVTLSQTLSWSHFIELATIEDATKRLYYQQLSAHNHWSLRELRRRQDAMDYERSFIATKQEDDIVSALSAPNPTENPEVILKSSYVVDFLGLHGYFSEKDLEAAIISQLEKFILELGNGFAFLERQKRISIDGIDYYIDLLFYHRKLNRLIAIDLKLGKFKPDYKGQMELYLKYLQRYERQPHENEPIGLLLCSEGNTDHIELMMLGEDNIKVAQYLTELPEKKWFADKLTRSIEIARSNQASNSKQQ